MSLVNIVGGSSLLIFVIGFWVVRGVFTWALLLLWLNFPNSGDSINWMINRIIVGLQISLLNIAILIVLRQQSRILFLDFLCLAIFIYLFYLIFG